MSFTLQFSYLFHFFPVPVPISFHDVCCHWQWLEWSRCWNIDFLSLLLLSFFFSSLTSLSFLFTHLLLSFSLCLSVSHTLSSPHTPHHHHHPYSHPRHWYQRSSCWLIALLSGNFPLLSFSPLSSRCCVSLFTGLLSSTVFLYECFFSNSTLLSSLSTWLSSAWCWWGHEHMEKP